MTKRYNSQRYKRRNKKEQAGRIKVIFIFSVLLIFAVYVFAIISSRIGGTRHTAQATANTAPVDITVRYLTPNKYSRPGKKLGKVNGIVVHYTANPGSDAEANRNYFNNLPAENAGKDKPVYASSHYVIGLDGEIVQCIPLDEIAYASNDRNSDTISIECCHPDKTGRFNEATYESLVRLTAWLCGEYDLKKDDIIRHYDVTGKDCPRYYVKHEKKWNSFKKDVFEYIENNKVTQ